MSDRDIEQIADAYLVNLANADDRPLDDARYNPLAADTADFSSATEAIAWFKQHGRRVDRNSACLTCGDTRIITIPDPTSSAYFPKPDRTYRCPDCTGRRS